MSINEHRCRQSLVRRWQRSRYQQPATVSAIATDRSTSHMINFTHRAVRAAGAAATLLGVVVLASPVMAGNSKTISVASSSQAMGSPASADANAVEARIKELHRKLHITAAQKPQWDSLAQVMRDNAQAMSDLKKQRASDAQTMNEVDVVKSYESVIEAHEDGMKKFVPPFEALYNTMSDAQKKTADSLFRTREKVSAAKQTASK